MLVFNIALEFCKGETASIKLLRKGLCMRYMIHDFDLGGFANLVRESFSFGPKRIELENPTTSHIQHNFKGSR